MIRKHQRKISMARIEKNDYVLVPALHRCGLRHKVCGRTERCAAPSLGSTGCGLYLEPAAILEPTAINVRALLATRAINGARP